jgi:penicillin amidase
MDRLFQMELTKRLIAGRVGELAGKKARRLDIRMRTLGFHRQAKKHLKLLNKETLILLQQYVRGINTFIQDRPQNHHLEFKLAGTDPEIWEPEDCLSILYFMGWTSAANLQHEIVAQMLVDKLGLKKALEIFPLNINPEETFHPSSGQWHPEQQTARISPEAMRQLGRLLTNQPLAVGSNNWVAGPGMSPAGMPIVANDPHLDARILPGPWYPCGMITPDLRAVGVSIPGTPGMVIGRTRHLAFGITNAYGDTQDLYVETIDPLNPDRYLEGKQARAFEVIEEILRFRDNHTADGFKEEPILIHSTRRGPVVSSILPGMPTDRVLTVRWSSYESMAPSLGFDKFLDCRNATEFRRALKDVNQIVLNFVFADIHGNFGWQTTGRLPIRSPEESHLPYTVTDSKDNWTGWIPWDQMPHAVNPARGWVGTTNHKTVPSDYPYYYSTFLASSHRQRRLIELMAAPGKKTADDHWRFQRDILNLKAKSLAPLFAQVLRRHEETRPLGDMLAAWDAKDAAGQAAPTVFHFMFEELAALVFTDELGPKVAKTFLRNRYFWDERLEAMLLAGDSVWFDDTRTSDCTETRDDLIRQAAVNVSAQLAAKLGANPSGWLWGKLHRYTFVNPVRRSGFASLWLGGGAHPAAGSGDTLRRARYEYYRPSRIHVSASLRMVADLADPHKVLAVLPGGVTGRLFDPHTTDQIEPFLNGEKTYWWFSDEQIEAHKHHELSLVPGP